MKCVFTQQTHRSHEQEWAQTHLYPHGTRLSTEAHRVPGHRERPMLWVPEP